MNSRNYIVLGAAAAATCAAIISLFLSAPPEADTPADTQAEAPASPLPPMADAAGKEGNDREAIEGEVYYDEDAPEQQTGSQRGLTPEELAKLPAWAREFSKLGKEARAQFMRSFSIAKSAYAHESWAECVSILNECEVIFDGNPNVWNLRACALLELGEHDEAETYIRRTLEDEPDSPIGLLNLTNLQMARQDYGSAIPALQRLREVISQEKNQEQMDIFTFRQLLCHLMLGQEKEARALVADINALYDSPLFYYAQAAFAIHNNDSKSAREALASASRIFSSGPLLRAYRKWLDQSGLKDKCMLPEESAGRP